MKRFMFATFGTLALLAGLVPLAHASPINYIHDGFNYGGLFDLIFVGQSDTDYTYRFEYVAMFPDSGDDKWTGPDYIEAVAFKLSGNKPKDVSLVSAPDDESIYWNTLLGGLSAGGCGPGNSDNSGFACAQAFASSTSTDYAPLSTDEDDPGDSYSWLFDVTFEGPATNDDLQGASIKALFVKQDAKNGGYKQNGLLSQNLNATVAVPEPGGLLLLGLGLLGVGALSYANRRHGKVGSRRIRNTLELDDYLAQDKRP
ncbi:MAG TPA: PEP-CTERM sorting domain-containing protein [Gammaproteobacteria bacterium]|nr:PEP-CTERM sorting domain-containing protein [Gammaproteobacteria bacterium]